MLTLTLACADQPAPPLLETSSNPSTSDQTGAATTSTTSGGFESSSEASGSSTGDVVHPIRFVDVTVEAGLDSVEGELRMPPDCLLDNVVSFEPGDFCFPEWFSGGVAVADYDADGRPDLYVTRHGAPDHLYHNEGDGTFSDRAAGAGLDLALPSIGAAFGDIDDDGDLDLYVTTVVGTQHYLFVNDGSGQFSEESDLRGVSLADGGPRLGTTPAFGDYDRDGYLDLYVAEWYPAKEMGGAGGQSRLFRNLGDANPGAFEDVTDAAGVAVDDVYLEVDAKEGQYGFAPAFVDLDSDGWADLVIASDFGTSRLFWNDGDGTFTDGTGAAGVGTDRNGMGSTFADIDGDGDLDWFVTAIWNRLLPELGNRLYRNEGNRSFTDVTDAYDLRDGGWGWGTAFLDVENDGDPDLVMTAGWRDDSHALDPMLLWIHDGTGLGQEQAADAGLTTVEQGRGLVTLDYDGDGDLDLFVAHHAQAPVLYRNDSEPTGSWLRVQASIGARVTVQATPNGPARIAEIGVGSHFLGHGQRVAHFGLDDHRGPVAEVRVYWPALDTEQVLSDIPIDSVVVVEEP